MSDVNNLAVSFDVDDFQEDEDFIYVSEQGCEINEPELNYNVRVICPKLDIEYLFNSRYQQLKGFIRKRIHNDYDVEDIVQSTYMEAIKKADNFKGLSRPDVWLFGIALNLVRNHTKKEMNRSRMWEAEYGGSFSHSDSHSIPSFTDVDNNPCDHIDRTQQIGLIDRTLATLPKEMKQVIHTIVIENKTYQEAAKVLNVPTGTVRSRLSRARDKFKEVVSS